MVKTDYLHRLLIYPDILLDTENITVNSQKKTHNLLEISVNRIIVYFVNSKSIHRIPQM